MVDPPELQRLRERALACALCPLSERRRNVVFGEGDPGSPLVLVGEGPGDTEDASGRPFVGKAGKLLDQALADIALTRDDVYVCNVVKCRACDWSTGKPVNRPPSVQEIAACRPWLEAQLAVIKPEVILCIGAPSAKAIIKPDFRITVERGKYFPCRLAKTALATLHPAYILRQRNITADGGYSLLVADIAKGWEAAKRLRSQKTFVTLDEPKTAQGILFE